MRWPNMVTEGQARWISDKRRKSFLFTFYFLLSTRTRWKRSQETHPFKNGLPHRNVWKVRFRVLVWTRENETLRKRRHSLLCLQDCGRVIIGCIHERKNLLTLSFLCFSVLRLTNWPLYPHVKGLIIWNSSEIKQQRNHLIQVAVGF